GDVLDGKGAAEADVAEATVRAELAPPRNGPFARPALERHVLVLLVADRAEWIDRELVFELLVVGGAEDVGGPLTGIAGEVEDSVRRQVGRERHDRVDLLRLAGARPFGRPVAP